MSGQVILPRNVENPVGGTDRINRTSKAIVDGLDVVKAWLIDRLSQIHVTEIVINKSRYDYQISIVDLESIIRELQMQLDNLPSDYVVQQTLQAYEAGTGLAVVNLANISEDYTRNITQVLINEPYQRRAALVGARVFEEMKGFENQAGLELGRILRRAVQDGLNPRDVTGEIEQRFGISERRAETIARTEITGALRRGRWDEARDARERLGINVALLWVSALSPTTRHTHAIRHGSDYTIEQVAEFYSVDANAINCKCSQAECLLNSEGEPVQTKAVEKLKEQKEKYFGLN